MFRSDYYRQMKALANSVRTKYDVETNTFGLSRMRLIYRTEGIRIDMQKLSGRKIRAAYFCDGGDPSVLLSRGLPKIPRLFSLGHELKHHYCDRQSIEQGKIQCGDYNAHEMIEIGAEIFAAELIYPEKEFLELAGHFELASGNCDVDKIVHFKKACPATISYKFLLKRLEWFDVISKGEYGKVHFQKREAELYGVPIYKQAWFVGRRARVGQTERVLTSKAKDK